MGPRLMFWSPKRRMPRIPLNPATQTNIRRLAGKRIEDWKIAKLNRIAKERENAVAAGELVDLETVTARVSQAGVAFQRGHAAARRSIEAVCCDKCRGPVVAEHEAAMNATIIAVRGALEVG